MIFHLGVLVRGKKATDCDGVPCEDGKHHPTKFQRVSMGRSFFCYHVQDPKTLPFSRCVCPQTDHISVSPKPSGCLVVIKIFAEDKACSVPGVSGSTSSHSCLLLHSQGSDVFHVGVNVMNNVLKKRKKS